MKGFIVLPKPLRTCSSQSLPSAVVFKDVLSRSLSSASRGSRSKIAKPRLSSTYSAYWLSVKVNSALDIRKLASHPRHR